MKFCAKEFYSSKLCGEASAQTTNAGCHVNQAPRCLTPLCHYHAAKGLTITYLSFTNTNTTLIQVCLTDSFDEI